MRLVLSIRLLAWNLFIVHISLIVFANRPNLWKLATIFQLKEKRLRSLYGFCFTVLRCSLTYLPVNCGVVLLSDYWFLISYVGFWFFFYYHHFRPVTLCLLSIISIDKGCGISLLRQSTVFSSWPSSLLLTLECFLADSTFLLCNLKRLDGEALGVWGEVEKMYLNQDRSSLTFLHPSALLGGGVVLVVITVINYHRLQWGKRSFLLIFN